MNIHQAIEILRILVNQDRVFYTKHADIRDPSSGKMPLSRRDIIRCLKTGIITEGPTPDIKISNGFKITISRINQPKNEVVAIIIPDEYILIITAYAWD